jgi:hypothetical protein
MILKESLLIDPSFAWFGELEQYASKLPELYNKLYDKHDGRPLEENEELWDGAYCDKLMVQVVGNFSHERVDHLKAVVRKLYPVDEQSAPYEKTDHVSEENHEKDAGKAYQHQSPRDVKGAVVGGTIAGGVIGGAFGAFASFSAGGVVLCAIGGAALGGGAAYMISTRR